MLFGFTNMSAVFQRFIFSVLKKYLDIFVMVYLDDILIFLKTIEEYIQYNKKVFQKLREAKVTLKLKKYEFYIQKTDFLGYIISNKRFSIQKDKVKSILDWPISKNVKEVQQFIGLYNYYGCSIDGFGKIAVNLNKLLKKDQKWIWDNQSKKLFNDLKKIFVERTIFVPADSEKQYTIETDVSDYVFGVGLTQPGDNRKFGPVIFWSRKIISAEINYDIYNKELLAIVLVFKIWRVYLEEAKYQIIVKSDHKNLIFFITTKELIRRQARWAEILARYDYRIEYCPGTANVQMDALSRRSDYIVEIKEAVPAIFKKNEAGDLVYNHQVLAATSEIQDDEWISRLKESLASDLFTTKEMNRDYLKKENGLIYIHRLIYILQELQNEAIRGYHDDLVYGYIGIEKTVEQFSRNYYILNIYKKVARYIKKCDICQRNKAARHKLYNKIQILETPIGL